VSRLLLPVVLALAAALGGCNPNGAGSACQAAKGQCFIGQFRVSCGSIAPDAAQDCNPNENAGGGFCCLSEPDAAVAAPEAGPDTDK